MLTSPVEALRQLFMFEQRPNLMPRYNIAPTQDVPIVRLTRDRTARELITVRWGLVPFWADDLSIGNRLITPAARPCTPRGRFAKPTVGGAASCRPTASSNGRSRTRCASGS
jgi:putative SOS response-associated peptidase YedK